MLALGLANADAAAQPSCPAETLGYYYHAYTLLGGLSHPEGCTIGGVKLLDGSYHYSGTLPVVPADGSDYFAVTPVQHSYGPYQFAGLRFNGFVSLSGDPRSPWSGSTGLQWWLEAHPLAGVTFHHVGSPSLRLGAYAKSSAPPVIADILTRGGVIDYVYGHTSSASLGLGLSGNAHLVDAAADPLLTAISQESAECTAVAPCVVPTAPGATALTVIITAEVNIQPGQVFYHLPDGVPRDAVIPEPTAGLWIEPFELGVYYTTTPEPATLVLSAGGLLTLAGVARRRSAVA